MKRKHPIWNVWFFSSTRSSTPLIPPFPLLCISELSLSPSPPPSPPPSPSFPFCSFLHPSPHPLLAEEQSRWVFSGCYDLRDDNGSYNVASRSWCGWVCGGFCCVSAGDGGLVGVGRKKVEHEPTANHSPDFPHFQLLFLFPCVSFSRLTLNVSGSVVFLWW